MDPRIKRIYAPDPTKIPISKPRTRTNRKDFEGNGHWVFDEPLGQSKEFGFIYVIRDCRAGKGYIGKKQFLGAGRQNKGVVSNWQWYVSSSQELVNQIRAHGKDSFEFIVLEQYKTRGGLGFAETWTKMQAETPANYDKWYNKLVDKVTWPSKERITLRHKERLQMIINNEILKPVGVSL